MSLRDTLRKAAGLLVELPPEEARPTSTPMAPGGEQSSDDLDALLADLERAGAAAAKPSRTVEEIVKSSEGPNLDQITVPPSTGGGEINAAGKIDFAAIYLHASLPNAPFTAEQLIDMLASLPAELPLDTKRQTVRVSLDALGKTMGATPDTIVADASRKLAALAAYLETLSRSTTESIHANETEIKALEEQIEERKRKKHAAQQLLFQATQLCTAESERLDDVLEFFSLDLPPSRYAPGQ